MGQETTILFLELGITYEKSRRRRRELMGITSE
jgi:hypothetical protein